jgi:hypothetical protein
VGFWLHHITILTPPHHNSDSITSQFWLHYITILTPPHHNSDSTTSQFWLHHITILTPPHHNSDSTTSQFRLHHIKILTPPHYNSDSTTSQAVQFQVPTENTTGMIHLSSSSDVLSHFHIIFLKNYELFQQVKRIQFFIPKLYTYSFNLLVPIKCRINSEFHNKYNNIWYAHTKVFLILHWLMFYCLDSSPLMKTNHSKSLWLVTSWSLLPVNNFWMHCSKPL